MHARSLSVCFAVLTLIAEPRAILGADPRLYLEWRTTLSDRSDEHAELMARELPRQALLVAAAQDLSLITADPSLDLSATPRDGDVRVVVLRRVAADLSSIHIDLLDASGKPIDAMDLPLKTTPAPSIDYADLVAKVDQLVLTKWQAALAKHCSVMPRPARWDASLPAPKQAEQLLSTVDFLHAFLAARLTHQAIAESGESPARLGVLVRAYAHLGDATRHLFNGQSSALFARSLVYAQRLTRLAPDDPNTYWHRAYVEALYGLPGAADADLRRGDELAAAAKVLPPSWVTLLHDLLAFRTGELFDKLRGPDGALASYFAWLTVEHSPLASIAINFARIAGEQNLGAVRAHDALSANGGVSLLHQTTLDASRTLNRLVVKLASEASVAEPVRDATKKALDAQFSTDAVVALLRELESMPDEPGQPLPWSALASIVRECQFVNCFRRLYFVRYQWGVDTDDDLASWWPLIKTHRYAPVIAAFDRSGRFENGAGSRERIAAIEFKDDSVATHKLHEHLFSCGITEDGRQKLNFGFRSMAQRDRNAWEFAHGIWVHRDSGDPGFDWRLSQEKYLQAMSPKHPVGLAMRMLDDWKAIEPRAKEIEESMGEHPIVAYALGASYAWLGRGDEALPLLEKAAETAPDRPIYHWLAKVHLDRNDEDAWLRTWEKYMQVSEDFGLDHAKVCSDIAKHFLKVGKPERALPYAQRAADSGSNWSMQGLASVYHALREYDKAAAMYQASAERYGNTWRFYQYCRMTGHGDVAAAARMYERLDPEIRRSANVDELRGLAIVCYLEGKTAQADELYQQIYPSKDHLLDGLLLAMLRLEQKRPDDARALLRKVASATRENEARGYYVDVATEIDRCMNDSNAVPSRDGAIGKLIAHDDADLRGNLFYMFGRFCDLRGNKDEAKKWYRATLDLPDDNFPCRAMAAAALRALGEEYYKEK